MSGSEATQPRSETSGTINKDGSATYIVKDVNEYVASVQFSVNDIDNITMVNAILFFDPVFSR